MATVQGTTKLKVTNGCSQLGRLRRRKAMERGEFVPYFQPLVELRTGHVTGFEVLARWNHPEAGLLLPEAFIPQAEQEGWVGDLTQHLLRSSLQCAQKLDPSASVAINVSPLQLQDLTLPDQLTRAARQWGFSLDRLIVEVTETAFTTDRDRALLIARELKQLGCQLALDDFGTGYSSLRSLQALPFDVIKVDRSFVSSMQEHRGSRKIVAAVVGLGQSLGITTVAEGIETQEQADMLLWLGCDLGQGYLYGKPLPEEQLCKVPVNPKLFQMPKPKICKRVNERSFDATPVQRLAHLQAVYDGAPVGLAFLDHNLRYRNLNQRMANMNGASIESHLGNKVAELRPDLFPHIRPYIERALAGEAIQDLEVTFEASATSREQTLLLSYQPALDEADEIIGVSVAAIDLTKYKQTREESPKVVRMARR